MKIYCIDSQGFSSNTYILENNGEAFVFDPGADENEIFKTVSEIGAKPVGIILTHGHFDHTLSLTEVREKYQIPVLIHELDAEMLTDSVKNAGKMLLGQDFCNAPADKTFTNGDEMMLGGDSLKVIHTPGHTKGSSCFLTGKMMITGDTIFARGFGRYDLYGGDGKVLFNSLENLKNFDGSIRIYPGHGESATLERALRNIGL